MRGSIPRMTWRGRCVNFSIVIFSVNLLSRGGAEPLGASRRTVVPNCRFRTLRSPQAREAERRNSRARIAAPVGGPYGRACPSSGRERPVHNADRRASRRPTAAVSLDPETAFWERTGAADRRNALDSTGFHPLSSAPPARCRTDPCSWAGRCLLGPPEARLARPNPQAPRPSPFACAS